MIYKKKNIFFFTIVFLGLPDKTISMSKREMTLSLQKIPQAMSIIKGQIRQKNFSADYAIQLIQTSKIELNPFIQWYDGMLELYESLENLIEPLRDSDKPYRKAYKKIFEAYQRGSNHPSQKPPQEFFHACLSIKTTIISLLSQ